MEPFRHPANNPAQGFIGQLVPCLDHMTHQQPKAQEVWWFSTKPGCPKVVFHRQKAGIYNLVVSVFFSEHQRNGGFPFHQQMYMNDSYTSLFLLDQNIKLSKLHRKEVQLGSVSQQYPMKNFWKDNGLQMMCFRHPHTLQSSCTPGMYLEGVIRVVQALK